VQIQHMAGPVQASEFRKMHEREECLLNQWSPVHFHQRLSLPIAAIRNHCNGSMPIRIIAKVPVRCYGIIERC
jgi:hypothetical protein